MGKIKRQPTIADAGGIEIGKIIFVAFGDSLTVGYQSPTIGYDWPEAAPYTKFLKDMTVRLIEDLSMVGFKVVFHNKGIVGELTQDMLDRFNRDVVDLQPDCTIILGGSNDVGLGVPLQNIMANLIEMYNEALGHQIKPIACTLPSVLGFDEGIPDRIELNGSIKMYCLKNDIVCVDLFAATSDSKTKRLKKELSNDGLHLNGKGYEVVAETIFENAVRKIIMEAKHSPFYKES